MTMTDTNVQNLIINELTKQQYESIQSPSDTELYIVTDEPVVETVNNVAPDANGNVSISIPTQTVVKINNTSITSSGVANIVTNTAYNSSSNKIATMSDIPTIATSVSSSSTNAQTVGAKLFYDTVGDIETLLQAV